MMNRIPHPSADAVHCRVQRGDGQPHVDRGHRDVARSVETLDAHSVERDVQLVVVRGDQDVQGHLRTRFPRRPLPDIRCRLRLRLLLHTRLSAGNQVTIAAVAAISTYIT